METRTPHHHAAVALVAVNQKTAPLNMRTVRLVEMSHVLVEAIANSKNAVVKRYNIFFTFNLNQEFNIRSRMKKSNKLIYIYRYNGKYKKI